MSKSGLKGQITSATTIRDKMNSRCIYGGIQINENNI